MMIQIADCNICKIKVIWKSRKEKHMWQLKEYKNNLFFSLLGIEISDVNNKFV